MSPPAPSAPGTGPTGGTSPLPRLSGLPGARGLQAAGAGGAAGQTSAVSIVPGVRCVVNAGVPEHGPAAPQRGRSMNTHLLGETARRHPAEWQLSISQPGQGCGRPGRFCWEGCARRGSARALRLQDDGCRAREVRVDPKAPGSGPLWGLGLGLGPFWGWAVGLGLLWGWTHRGFVPCRQGSRTPHHWGPVWMNLQVSCSGLY